MPICLHMSELTGRGSRVPDVQKDLEYGFDEKIKTFKPSRMN